MMGLLVINTGAFLMVAIAYEYKAVEHKRTASPSVVPHSHSADVSGTPPITGAQMPHHIPPASSAAASSAMNIRTPSARATGAMEAAVDGEDEETGSEATGSYASVYARSLAYQPVMPAMPAPFR